MPPRELLILAALPAFLMCASCQTTSRSIICPPVATVAPGDWRAAEQAFADAPALEFAQSWREENEPNFRPGSVRIGWRGDRFVFLANLTDDAPTTSARHRNEKLWMLGDVLEIFAGAQDDPAYIEYHAAPNGLVLQLLWPNANALASVSGDGELHRFMLEDNDAIACVRRTPTGWQVHGEIPAKSVVHEKKPPKSLRGQIWNVNFGRYDYGTDKETPTLSSTSPLTRPAYHRRDEWQTLRFADHSRQAPDHP